MRMTASGCLPQKHYSNIKTSEVINFPISYKKGTTPQNISQHIQPFLKFAKLSYVTNFTVPT